MGESPLCCGVVGWGEGPGRAQTEPAEPFLGFGVMLLERALGPQQHHGSSQLGGAGEGAVLAGSVALGSPQPLGGCLGVLTARGDGQGGAGPTWPWS